MTPFGAFCRRSRLLRGVSLTQQAKAVGVSRSYVSRVENGHASRPTFEYMDKVANFLKLSQAERDAMQYAWNASNNRIKFWHARPEYYELMYLWVQKGGGLSNAQILKIREILNRVEILNMPEKEEGGGRDGRN